MGVRLIVEVLDHAPAELSPLDRLLLVVIAEDANDTTREGFPGWELIARRMRWTGHKDGGKGAVRSALAKLAEHGVDVRVPLTKGKDGRAVYAASGHRTVYRIPPLRRGAIPAPLEGGQSLPPLTEKGGQSLPAKGGNPDPSRGAIPAPPSPQVPSASPQQREGQPSDEERAAVMAEIRRRKPGANEGLIRHVYRQDGPAILAEIREHAGRQHIAAWIAALASQPPCEHGQPGGAQLRPDTGDPHCALCRARRRRSAA